MLTLADKLELLAFDLALERYPQASVNVLYEAAQQIRAGGTRAASGNQGISTKSEPTPCRVP
jgi:hypothetical protein